MHSGSGGGAAKATVRDLQLTHTIDRASPNLASYCFQGRHIAQAILTVRKAGGAPIEYLKLTMSDVIITHIEPVVDDDAALEQINLSFARIQYEYMLQNALGGSQGVVTAVIDVKANQAS